MGFSEFSIGGVPPATNSRFAFEVNNRPPGGSTARIRLIGRAQDTDGTGFTVSDDGTMTAGRAFIAASINYQTGQQKIWINAVLMNTAINPAITTGNTSNTPTANAGIGSSDDGLSEFMNGRIEDLRIYNRVLSDDEVLTIFGCQGVDGIVFGLRSRYELQSGPTNKLVSDLSAQDSGPVAQDAYVFNGSTPTYAPSIGPTFRRRLP
jgi:hypothetical protein